MSIIIIRWQKPRGRKSNFTKVLKKDADIVETNELAVCMEERSGLSCRQVFIFLSAN